MSQLDALLERSRAPGTFVEKRTFTLARSKAIEKMREFSLRDPHEAVLELVQAAVFAGARWIAVDTSADALVVAWVGGETLSRDQLEDLFDFLFADQGVQETRHLMQAAIGVNALLQRRPRRIRLESGDGSTAGTTRMDLDKNGKGEVGLPESPLAGTYLMCEFGGSWFGRFTGGDSSAKESGLVETRCLYTPTPILLNGAAPFGYRTSRTVQLFGVKRAVQIQGERRGALGVPQRGVSPGVRLVVGGVWVTTREIDILGPDLVGVLADDRLRKTADMSDIVEDARWIDMLHAVQPEATRLMQAIRGPSYRPPRLPARIEERPHTAVEAEVALEPLPDRVVQVQPRATVPLGVLTRMEADEPLFWVEEDVVSGLVAPCDPVRFPYRVLVLTPGQARTLEATLGDGGPRLSRLTNPEDVSFVRNAMERRHGVHQVRVEASVHLDGERSPRTMPLTLRLHLAGPPPRWDAAETLPDGAIPLATVSDGATVRCGHLDVNLHDVSVVVDVSAHASASPALLETALRRTVQREAWRLLPTEPTRDPWRRRLELALLADHARPHFVREDGRAPEVRARFPVAWRDVVGRLVDAPLVDTTEGPLTLAGFVELIDEGGVRTLTRPSERAVVEPLEARFGFGHLVVPDDLREPLVAVARTMESWSARGGESLGGAATEEVILVFAALAEPDPPPGWVALPRLAPGIARWRRIPDPTEPAGDAAEAADASASPTLPSGAVSALLDRLRALDRSDWEARPAHLSTARARALGRLAALRLAARADRLGDVALSDLAGRSRPASAWLSDGELHIAARGGATTDQATLLPLCLDELRVLEAWRRARSQPPLPLLLDDHPELWDDRHEGNRWLVTLSMDHAGLRGWLGLRLPFDPTPGVLLEAADQLEVLPAFTARVPCHGLLHLTGGRRLSRAQSELLHFAGMQLYQLLLRKLDEDLPPSARDAGLAYAARFAQRTWQRDQRLGPGLARSLAQRVPVTDDGEADGAPWGTLLDWLEAEPTSRPPGPAGIDPEPTEARTGEVVHLADASETWGFLQGPLQRALRAQLPGVSVTVHEGLENGQLALTGLDDATTCHLHLNRNALADKALAADPRARGLLLVEATRLALRWADRVQLHVDPLALQQAVLAARLL